MIEEGEVGVKEEEIRDVLSEAVVGYKRTYFLKDNLVLREGDEDLMNFFKYWVRKSRSEILNYVYMKYLEYTRYSIIRDKILGALDNEGK
ncbi:hypothetical protein [Acidianus sp. HS-5]|uniref:hypothetical protein n=1 Tax=Acidianus sp. HS-5 TaxID=2886040 RepID=UPI001F2EDB35|nr:hypothetical protein [Acidianus sp. HS-5]BDC17377.1 hypothetical protein HS5_02670 [Acidianus sp. HS-5]